MQGGNGLIHIEVHCTNYIYTYDTRGNIINELCTRTYNQEILCKNYDDMYQYLSEETTVGAIIFKDLVTARQANSPEKAMPEHIGYC